MSKHNSYINQTEDMRVSMELLNAIETAILKYGREHSDFITNAYWWFAEQLGYKSKNYIYNWFTMRDRSKIGLEDVKKIYKITGDENIIKELVTDFTEVE